MQKGIYGEKYSKSASTSIYQNLNLDLNFETLFLFAIKNRFGLLNFTTTIMVNMDRSITESEADPCYKCTFFCVVSHVTEDIMFYKQKPCQFFTISVKNNNKLANHIIERTYCFNQQILKVRRDKKPNLKERTAKKVIKVILFWEFPEVLATL